MTKQSSPSLDKGMRQERSWLGRRIAESFRALASFLGSLVPPDLSAQEAVLPPQAIVSVEQARAAIERQHLEVCLDRAEANLLEAREVLARLISREGQRAEQGNPSKSSGDCA